MSTQDSNKNKNKYTSSRLTHIISSLPYAFKSIFSRRDKKLIVFCAMHCQTFDSNSKFLFLHFLKNCPDYTVKFVVNDDSLRQTLIAQYGDHFIDTRTKQGKAIAVKAGIWVVSWLDLPLGGLFLNFRRLVVHLGHGTPLKGIGLAEKDGKFIKRLYYRLNNTNISYSLASTDFLSDIISRCMGLPKKRILISGQPRIDSLFEPPESVPEISDKQFNVLYAPTWRQFSQVKLFPFDDFELSKLDEFLTQNNIHIFVRFHPAYEEQIPQDILKLSNVTLFSARKYTEVMDYINCFNALITDYSSIYLDYMVLENPIIFLPYDLAEYEASVGFTMDYSENTPGPKPQNFQDFLTELKNIKENPEPYRQQIKLLNAKLNNPSKQSCSDMEKIIRNKTGDK